MLQFARRCYFPDGGDGTGGGDGDGTTSIKVDNTNGKPPEYTPPELDMATALPPEYREKPYLKGKDFVTIIKEFDNAQKLIGSRPAGIPAEDAPDADWDKFIGTLRPKDLAEYALPETEYSKAVKRSPEYEKAIREIMAEAGVPKRLFPKAIQKVESWLFEGHKKAKERAEAEKVSRETEFNTLLDSTYGKDRQVVVERAKNLMVEAVAPELKEKVSGVLKDIPNDVLFALTAVLNGVHAKYLAEDNPPGSGPTPGGDPSTLQAEAEGIMKSDAYKDFRNPGHDAAKQKVQDIFSRIAGMKK